MKVRYPQSLTTAVFAEFSRLPFVLLHMPSLHTESVDSVIQADITSECKLTSKAFTSRAHTVGLAGSLLFSHLCLFVCPHYIITTVTVM